MTLRAMALMVAAWQLVACTLTARRELSIQWHRGAPADARPCGDAGRDELPAGGAERSGSPSSSAAPTAVGDPTQLARPAELAP